MGRSPFSRVPDLSSYATVSVCAVVCSSLAWRPACAVVSVCLPDAPLALIVPVLWFSVCAVVVPRRPGRCLYHGHAGGPGEGKDGRAGETSGEPWGFEQPARLILGQSSFIEQLIVA
jgi:hypothetical protein